MKTRQISVSSVLVSLWEIDKVVTFLRKYGGFPKKCIYYITYIFPHNILYIRARVIFVNFQTDEAATALTSMAASPLKAPK